VSYKRDYEKEYREHGGTEEQKKRRAARNKARRFMERNGRASKGDGKEVDHKDFNPENNSPSNLRMVSRETNREKQPKRS
jgi:DNA replication protein DnaC